MKHTIILGIDPGTFNTGYACIKALNNQQITCLAYGTISSKNTSFKCRLHDMHKGIQEICKLYAPHHLAIEKVFLGKNPDVAFKLGHIFALCMLESEKRDILFFEYASRFIKKSVSSSGSASKQTIKRFVTNRLALPENQESLDATDALAVALCHNTEYQNKKNHSQLYKACL